MTTKTVKRPRVEYPDDLPASADHLYVAHGNDLHAARDFAYYARWQYGKGSKAHKQWEWIQYKLDARIREMVDTAAQAERRAEEKRERRIGRVLALLKRIGPLADDELAEMLSAVEVEPGHHPDLSPIAEAVEGMISRAVSAAYEEGDYRAMNRWAELPRLAC
jgi:hypothetical protein